jgi:hypothetical protein
VQKIFNEHARYVKKNFFFPPCFCANPIYLIGYYFSVQLWNGKKYMTRDDFIALLRRLRLTSPKANVEAMALALVDPFESNRISLTEFALFDYLMNSTSALNKVLLRLVDPAHTNTVSIDRLLWVCRDLLGVSPLPNTSALTAGGTTDIPYDQWVRIYCFSCIGLYENAIFPDPIIAFFLLHVIWSQIFQVARAKPDCGQKPSSNVGTRASYPNKQ